jgi:AcrR family transcriptional regulator
MPEPVKRRYDNSRRQAQVRATRLMVIEAAKRLFTEHGYVATTIDAIADAAGVPLPTVYRLFGSKRALLTAVLDTSFGGDDQPVAFADRPAVRAARAEPDPAKMVTAFARIAREFMERSSAIQHVLATAAQVDADAAELLADIRRQRHTASPGSSQPWMPGARSTPTSTRPRPPTSSTPCCHPRCTGSSPSSGAGPPTATSASSPDPSAASCPPASARQRPATGRSEMRCHR